MPTIGETSENASAKRGAKVELKSLTGVLERSALVASGRGGTRRLGHGVLSLAWQ